MTVHYKFIPVVLAFILGIPMLAGCSLHEDTKFTQNKVQVKQDTFVQEFPVADMNDNVVRSLGQQYERYGDGPVALTVTYDPHTKDNTAMMAGNAASKLVSAFRMRGMKDVRTSIMPVKDSGSVSTAIISFRSYSAQAPEGCDFMPGVKDRNVEADEDYKLGCSMETVYAKQIARPKDLLGQGEPTPTTDGRRASNIVDVYRSGAPNEPLEGESASGN